MIIDKHENSLEVLKEFCDFEVIQINNDILKVVLCKTAPHTFSAWSSYDFFFVLQEHWNCDFSLMTC